MHFEFDPETAGVPELDVSERRVNRREQQGRRDPASLQTSRGEMLKV